MPSLTAYADRFRDWEALLLAVRDNADSLPSVEPHRSLLEELLAEARSLAAQEGSAHAVHPESNQKLAKLVATGKKQAIRLLSVIRTDLGPDNERLVLLGVATPAAPPSTAAQEQKDED